MNTIDHDDSDRPASKVAAIIARAKDGELLSPKEVGAIFRLGTSRFYVLNKRGDFDHLKVRPAVGPRCFSGIKVYRYLCGDPVYEPTFGRGTRKKK